MLKIVIVIFTVSIIMLNIATGIITVSISIPIAARVIIAIRIFRLIIVTFSFSVLCTSQAHVGSRERPTGKSFRFSPSGNGAQK